MIFIQVSKKNCKYKVSSEDLVQKNKNEQVVLQADVHFY